MNTPKLLLTIFAILACISFSMQAAAQTDTLVGYLTKDWKRIDDPEKAAIFSVAVKRDSIWEAIYVNAEDNKRLVSCYFKDDFLTVMHGLYISYHEDGKTPYIRGWYQNGIRVGVWKSWYTNGVLNDSVIYDRGKVAVTYRFTTGETYGRKLGAIKDMRNDMTKYYVYNSDGSVAEEFERTGKNEDHKYYFANGGVRKHITKQNGKVTETCYLETGEPTKKCVEPKKINFATVMPEFPGGHANFQLYIDNNLRLPAEFNNAVNVGYTGKISFMLSEKGKAYDFKIIESSHPDLDQPLKDMVLNMPLWNMKEFKNGYGPVIIPIRFNLASR